jgi:hypothetical protein
MKRVYEDVLRLRMNNSTAPWFLVAGENSWTLPFLTPPMDWKLTPQWSQVVQARSTLGDPNEAFALVLDSQLPKDLPYEVLKSYPSSSFILKILPEGQQP